MTSEPPIVEAKPPRPRRWRRRAALAAGIGALGAYVYATQIEPHWVEIVRRDLPVERLPPRWQGRTLLQISDVHLGPQVADDYLIGAFRRAAELEPDVVLFTGDYVTVGPAHTDAAQFERVFKHMPHGKEATLGILGNHDYGHGWRETLNADAVVAWLDKLELRMLRNETADLAGLQIVGMDDLWSGRCEGDKALATSSPQSARIVACHNPDAADRPWWGDYRGWILAGHTHGGQCKPPFLPAPLLPVANRRYSAGEIALAGGRRLYINRGLGHLLKARFNARPEMTLFRLIEG